MIPDLQTTPRTGPRRSRGTQDRASLTAAEPTRAVFSRINPGWRC